jgi:hypothetical protein
MDYIGDSATIEQADEEAAYYQEKYGHEDTIPVEEDSDGLPF